VSLDGVTRGSLPIPAAPLSDATAAHEITGIWALDENCAVYATDTATTLQCSYNAYKRFSTASTAHDVTLLSCIYKLLLLVFWLNHSGYVKFRLCVSIGLCQNCQVRLSQGREEAKGTEKMTLRKPRVAHEVCLFQALRNIDVFMCICLT